MLFEHTVHVYKIEMICNHTNWCHPDDGGFSFVSGSFQGFVMSRGDNTIASGSLITDTFINM